MQHILIVLMSFLVLTQAQEVAPNDISAEVVSAEDTSTVLGNLSVSEAGGVSVTLSIEPNDVFFGGEHAIHIHETGSCEAADTDDDGETEAAGAAGEHYNPTEVGHGTDNGPHIGDSENYNYVFEDDGSFSGEILFPLASLTGENPILDEDGSALIIHAKRDDTTSDPGGQAGARVACAVINP